jgi:hypothetical protein
VEVILGQKKILLLHSPRLWSSTLLTPWIVGILYVVSPFTANMVAPVIEGIASAVIHVDPWQNTMVSLQAVPPSSELLFPRLSKLLRFQHSYHSSVILMALAMLASE